MYDGRHSPVHAGVGAPLRPQHARFIRRPYLIGDVGNAGTIVGTGVGGPAGAVVGTLAQTFLSNLFGGGANDRQRQARAAWTLSEANQGSPLAAAIIVAAPANVANDEAPFWRSAHDAVRPDMLSAATMQYPGGFWPKGQPDFFTDTNGATHRAIVAEVQSAGGTPTPVLSPSTTSGPYLMTPTSAPSLRLNNTLLIGVPLAAAALYFATRSPAPRRSRR